MQLEADSLAPGIGQIEVYMEVGFRCHAGFNVSAFREILTGFEQAADQGPAAGVQQDDLQPGKSLGTGRAVDDGQAQAQDIGLGWVAAQVTAQ